MEIGSHIFIEQRHHRSICRKRIESSSVSFDPAIAAQPDKADEVFIRKLRAILITANNLGLVRADDELACSHLSYIFRLNKTAWQFWILF